jgi:hypothetical protein
MSLVCRLSLQHRKWYLTSQLGFFASPSAIRLFVPAQNKDAPLAAYEFGQIFRLANLFNPTAHIGFASDLDTYRFAIAYS